ncbi:MAG: DNA repair exonuclease [Candidatus Aenigmarchaeota archaeon]|nr:DNA repair exonuclease [Candidatus Aenigmarchaeota archaeon]
MKFAHFSDVHLGSWSSSPELRNMAVAAFEKAVDISLSGKTDFIIISGDLFDTPMPAYDTLAASARILKKCRDAGVRVYVVPGSHDYSPSDKTFITVLENAGLLVNVAKPDENETSIRLRFVEDASGAKITGIMGKAGALERDYFRRLERESLEKEGGYKIFVFHSAIEEFRPKHLKDMAAVPLGMLPRNFSYYAAGHVHVPSEEGGVIFPGVLFPTEVPEMESYDSAIRIVENGKIMRVPVKLFEVETVSVNAGGKSPSDVEKEIILSAQRLELHGRLLIVKASGVLDAGNPSDISFSAIKEAGMRKGAFSVRKNFTGLSSRDYGQDKDLPSLSIEAIEDKVAEEFCVTKTFQKEKEMARNIMYALNDEKQEGETIHSFEERVKENAKRVLGL